MIMISCIYVEELITHLNYIFPNSVSIQPVSEFNEFKPRLKYEFKCNQQNLSRGLSLNFGSNSFNSASGGINMGFFSNCN